MIKFSPWFAVCLLGFTSALPAQAPAPAPSLAAAASPVATVLPADSPDILRAHVNETVDVRGTPTATGRSKSGTVAYLNFGKAHAAVSAVAFLSATASSDPTAHKVQSEDDLKSFVGKPIIIHGKLTDYKGDLQIKLDSLDQIKLAP